jgi:hypothetical protein
MNPEGNPRFWEYLGREGLLWPASVDTLPKGQDAKQGLAGTESGAVDAEGSETPNLQHPHQDTSGVSN